ncbi:MAG: hypothetical protein AABX73_01255 [Nanoarchaeota archaeon]
MMNEQMTRRSLFNYAGGAALGIGFIGGCIEYVLPLAGSFALHELEEDLANDITAEKKRGGGMRYTQAPRFIKARANVSGTLYSYLDDCLYIIEGERGDRISWMLEKLSGREKDKTSILIDKLEGTRWIGGGYSDGNKNHEGKSNTLPWDGNYAVIVSCLRESREELAEPIEFSLCLERRIE